jgi:transcriptional regulator with XRE-family HTH domain
VLGINYGKAVRRERLRRGLTQQGAAYQLGVSMDTLQKWEWGRHKPASELIGRVSAWLADPAYRHYFVRGDMQKGGEG